MSVQKLADEAYEYLRRDEGRDIVLPVDGAPTWFTDLCRSAHGEMWPDDWRYEFIGDALAAFSECVDPEECEPDVDDLYPYTHDRLRWIGSRLDRMSYCDEAMEETGGEFTDTAALIALGMWWEMWEVWGLVRQALADRLAEVGEGAG